MPKVKMEKTTKKDDKVEDDLNLDKEELSMKEKDLTVEDILKKIKVSKNEELRDAVSLDFGIIGCGRAGSKVAESFYQLGYKAIAINTATQDLINVDILEKDKLFLDIGIQGSAKDLQRGEYAALQYREEIYNKIKTTLNLSKVIIVCSSMGGGSGAGSLPVIIDLLQDIGKPIVVLAILPMVSEDVKAKSNSLETLGVLSKHVSNGYIHNLIVVDNARIEAIYDGVSQMEFYNVANKAIVEPLDAFNKFSMKPSNVKALDSAEFATMLLNGEGLSIYGQIIVKDYEDDTSIASAVINGLESNLLASGFDLKEARFAGFMVVANNDVWKKIPAGAINYASTMVNDVFGNPEGSYKGIYESDDEEDIVRVYSFASGLGLPKSRIDGLKDDVLTQEALIKNKDEDRKKKLTLDIGKDSVVSEVDKIKKRISSKGKGFGKLNEMVVDRRRK